jgi:hypothetical protein
VEDEKSWDEEEDEGGDVTSSDIDEADGLVTFVRQVMEKGCPDVLMVLVSSKVRELYTKIPSSLQSHMKPPTLTML